jgi:hypothetical protein
MKSRSPMPAGEREARSRLAQLAHAGEFLRGNLTLMRRVCGKPSCRCARGEKHESWYLCYSEGGRKRMVSVPRRLLAEVRDWLARHRRAKDCLEALAAAGRRRLRERKARKTP